MVLKAVGAVILVLVLAAGVVAWSFLFGQNLTVKTTPDGLLIDVQWCGFRKFLPLDSGNSCRLS